MNTTYSVSGRDINDMSQNQLIEIRDHLEEKAKTGDITPAQAARLREVKIAIKGIRDASSNRWL